MLAMSVTDIINSINASNEAFDALGLPDDASENEVKERFKILRKTIHPDKNGGSESSTEAFKKLQNFYKEIISQQQNRHNVDQESEEDGDYNDSAEEERIFQEFWEKLHRRERGNWEEYVRAQNSSFQEQKEKSNYTNEIFLWRILETFLMFYIILLLGIFAASIRDGSNEKPSFSIKPIKSPQYLSNQTVFENECYSKEFCAILFFSDSGMCNDFKRKEYKKVFVESIDLLQNELKRDYHGDKLRKLGTLWTRTSDQAQLFESIKNPPDLPFVLLANFARDKFWVKSVERIEGMKTVPYWILNGLRGREKDDLVKLKTSGWSRWSTRLQKEMLKIKPNDFTETEEELYSLVDMLYYPFYAKSVMRLFIPYFCMIM